jgi:flagellar assembly protein FliH
MWCRVVRGEKAAEAQPIAWQQARAAQPAPNAPSEAPRMLYTDPRAAESRQTFDDAEQRIGEAHQRGFREGEAAAAQRMAEQVRVKVEQLGRSIEQLAMHRAKIQREAEPELVRLALAIARRIMRRELTVDPDSLQGLLKAGLEKIESAEAHRVRVSPEHAQTVAALLEGSARKVEVASEPGLPVGAVIFETARGSVDVSMETQLKEIERGFADFYPR